MTQHRRLLTLLCAVFALLLAGTANADPLPPFDGLMSFPEIKGPSDPQDFSWQVTLYKNQALEQLDDQTAPIYYEPDHEPVLTITAEPAHDSLGTNVPTKLSVFEGDVITLTVHHRDGNPLAEGAIHLPGYLWFWLGRRLPDSGGHRSAGRSRTAGPARTT